MRSLQAVIPAAGFGTRMLPATKAVPKELLPILDRPTIQYVIEEAAQAGISRILLVTSRDKRAIEDHFDRNPELEAHLQAAGKELLLAGVNELIESVTIHSVRQSQPRGLGHAVLCARSFAGDEPFLCMLGDTIFSGEPSPAAQLLAAYAELKTSIIGLEEVAAQKVGRYGIVGGKEVSAGVFRVNELVEKPSPAAAPSRLAIAARYLLTPEIFDCLQHTPQGKGGEIQLTDAMRLLLQRQAIHGVLLKATRHDIGNPVDWLKTNLLYASRDKQLWPQLKGLMRKLMD